MSIDQLWPEPNDDERKKLDKLNKKMHQGRLNAINAWLETDPDPMNPWERRLRDNPELCTWDNVRQELRKVPRLMAVAEIREKYAMWLSVVTVRYFVDSDVYAGGAVCLTSWNSRHYYTYYPEIVEPTVAKIKASYKSHNGPAELFAETHRMTVRQQWLG